MNFTKIWRFTLALYVFSAMNYAAAQAPSYVRSADEKVAAESRSLNDWLMRMHEASRNRSYIGTFVVSAGGAISSAKIWHACEGGEQMERVETLTGPPRSIFRHNGQVVTFMPDNKLARIEKRDSLGLFPELVQSGNSRIADFYKLRQDGIERVAGVDSDIIVLSPKDNLRFGFRVWTERQSGLVLKLQTLDTDGRVLEQAAFSELQFDAPVKINKLVEMMGKTEGWRIEKPLLLKTTAMAEGWVLKTPVAGFNSISCFKRPATALIGATANVPASSMTAGGSLQWIFSDGLASVSIFVEPLDRQRHLGQINSSVGATQTLSRQLDVYWITVMGEVPMPTLRLFADGLERKK